MRLYPTVLTVLLIAVSAHAVIKPAGIFTDGTVLQQGEPVRIWGTADAGEEVAVEFAGQRVSETADADGKWMVTLNPMNVSSTGRKLIFSSASNDNQPPTTINNVVVGEVWLAGGQSNMAGHMRSYRAAYQSYIDSADDPLLRFVTIPRLEYEGQNDGRPEWLTTTPNNINSFSATAYFFAKNLREKLGVPVGIVSCSVGATPAEAWMSRDALASTPGLKKILDAYDAYMQKNYPDVEEYLREAKEQDKKFQVWIQKKRKGVSPLPPQPKVPMGPCNYKRPCGLYETMLTQTIPYTLRGVIWYQGENNTSAGFHYRTVFPALINEWRTDFMKPDLPFLFVQLATMGPARETSAAWPELRDAQLWTADHVENSGMVVIVDGGEEKRIHPHSKDKVGFRLSLLARNMVYGEKDLICRGPRLETATSHDNRIELEFKNTGSGLVMKPADKTPFEICGENGKYVPAEAKLVNGKIIVSADGVEQPRYVRYGWRKWFEPTLFNREGLPASPFKTDEFEPETKDEYYLDTL